MPARVLVVDPVDPVLDGILAKHGIQVERRIGLARGELLKIIAGYDAIVVRSRTRVDAELLEAGARGRLRVVARAGVGLDNIDFDAASKLGVRVVNTPGPSTQSVAELTIALMIMAARRALEANLRLREGEWYRPLGMELYGKRLFVVGFGRIGRRVAEIAKAIGMRVAAYDVVDVREEARARGVDLVASLRDGLREADVVSLHVPLTPQTYHLINRDTLRDFKRGAILVNTARGELMDTEAVLEALENGVLSAVAIDVHEREPPGERELRLIRHPRVVATPHIGASTAEAQRRIAVAVAEELARELGSLEGVEGGG
ncbi:hydroxyacid dehydrogenase [Stetteria hydrogenophila]